MLTVIIILWILWRLCRPWGWHRYGSMWHQLPMRHRPPMGGFHSGGFGGGFHSGGFHGGHPMGDFGSGFHGGGFGGGFGGGGHTMGGGAGRGRR